MNLTETDYKGAHLLVEVDSHGARLRINGILRQSADAGKPDSTIRLSSTVQTDYEWHEFIEAVVEYTADTIETTLIANGQSIAYQRFPGRMPV